MKRIVSSGARKSTFNACLMNKFISYINDAFDRAGILRNLKLLTHLNYAVPVFNLILQYPALHRKSMDGVQNHVFR